MCIRNNMDFVFINAYTKFYQNSSICSEDIEEKNILHQSRAITLLFLNKFSPFAIPNHSSLKSMSMQSLKKIGQKLLKLRVRKRHCYINQGHNSVIYQRIQPICNPKTLLPDIIVHAMFEENRSKTTQVRVRKFSEGIT